MDRSMRRSIIVVTLLTLGIGVVPVSDSQEPQLVQDERAAVLARLDEIQSAAEELDVKGLFEFVLENDKGALVQGGKVLLTRDQAIDVTTRGFQGLRELSYKFDQQHVSLLSSTVALAVGEGTSAATTDDGRQLSMRFAQTVVLVKSGNQWKVKHAHRSFPPAE